MCHRRLLLTGRFVLDHLGCGRKRPCAVKLEDDTYAIPSEIVGKNVSYWTDGSKVWAAGESAAKADIAGKTLYPISIQAAPVSYDETYGQLIYFDNFSGKTDFTNIADIKLTDFKYAAKQTFDGFTTLKCGQSPLSPNVVGIEVMPSDGANWVYTDGKTMTGKISIYAELYVDYDSLPGRFTVGAPGNGWGAYNTTWTLDKNTLSARNWGMIRSVPLSLAEYTNIGAVSNNWRIEYCRAIAVYIQPSNALWLVDSKGEKRTYSVASGETYTFPTNFNGVDVLTWKNGTTTYAAGATVEISAIAGKTWQVGETVGLAFDDSVSVRVSGTPGIRFKTNLNLAAYTNAKEIGFLATRDKHFNEQFGGLDENLVLTNEKVNNTKYCAHASVSAANIVDTGDGETASFNAVVINVPERKATLTETLHLRSYVTCGGVTYYSAVRKESIYEAAKKISESSGYQDNEYIKNILSICEDTSGN